jgi:hypothetical protein
MASQFTIIYDEGHPWPATAPLPELRSGIPSTHNIRFAGDFAKQSLFTELHYLHRDFVKQSLFSELHYPHGKLCFTKSLL